MAHYTYIFFCDNNIESNEYKRMIESEILTVIELHEKMTLFISMTTLQRIHLDLRKSIFLKKTLKCYHGPLSRQI